MDNKEINQQIEDLKEDYASILVDEQEEELAFLDKLNRLLQTIFNDSSLDVYTVLKPDQLEKWKASKGKRFLKRIFRKEALYLLLLLVITGFLVSEALPFYATAGVIGGKAYLKAILTEISFVFISGFRASGKLQTVLVSVLRASVFCLMLFVISSEVALEGTRDISKIDNIAVRVERLEKQVVKTEMDIQRYREINWPKNMTTSIRKREQLEQQIQELRDLQVRDGASEEVSTLLQYKIYGKAAFRLILMCIVVLITRRIFKF